MFKKPSTLIKVQILSQKILPFTVKHFKEEYFVHKLFRWHLNLYGAKICLVVYWSYTRILWKLLVHLDELVLTVTRNVFENDRRKKITDSKCSSIVFFHCFRCWRRVLSEFGQRRTVFEELLLLVELQSYTSPFT